ncbi:arabinose ABC transporter permease [Brevibacillus panacihumi W25]|uniref:Arabinose ABC transporter permease n=1 Tax=Brevibacillus panacihumi W25 TaxID=1408254 RepID=V6M6A8_9BACL|nr:MFS transporter [Brevibacillus panacihumi]EST54101.1 arabinose ABC transporter permease [Brevibacillus panacihumi W25]
MELSLWRNRSFVKLWFAQMTANIGDQFYSFALLWYLLQATKSGTALSLLVIPEMVAGLLFFLVGGVLADRYNPRLLMVGSDLARILVAIAVGIMAALGIEQFSFFLIAQFLLGLFSSLFQPARTVALKAIVPLEQLSRANAILDTTFRTIRILAPMSIGLLSSLLPLSALFFVNAVSYLLSVFFVYSISAALQPIQENGAPVKMTPSQYIKDIGMGMTELKRNHLLFLILVFSNVGFLVWIVCWNVGFPFLAEGMAQGDGSQLAVLIGSYGIGNLFGSLYMARAVYHRHLLVILIGWAVQAGGFLLLALGTEYHWLAYLAAAVAGIGGPLIGIPTVTAIQTKASGSNTGKIFSINMLMFTFFSMLSSMLGAIWLGKWPVEQLFLVSGLFLVSLAAIGFAWERSIEQHSYQQQADQSSS